ncbi:autotransporter family protein [Burkholderia plantarii]|uniref:autotransporter family protein n=1 Tax=Burkholderia plantarii TaxID=41899 RepID=UPI0018DC100D|nr:autotransporter domain-containing protein [Burkholderia plantarii]MBI0326942.1 autotransporter domain-containing protein [Burkholderia plantarii]
MPHHSTIPSFNFRRSAVSLAVLTAIVAAPAHAQSVVVDSSTGFVEIGGATGVEFGPDSTTQIQIVTNTNATVTAAGSDDAVTNNATVEGFDNGQGSAINATGGGSAILNGPNGDIVGLTNEGVITGTRSGITNDGAFGSISLQTFDPSNSPTISATDGPGVLNGPTGSIGTITLGTWGMPTHSSISGTTGLEDDGALAVLNVYDGTSITGNVVAGVALNSGTTNTTIVNGTVAGTGTADGLDVRGTADPSVAMIGTATITSQNASAVNVGPSASATFTLNDTSTIESGSGSALNVQAGGNVTVVANPGTTITAGGPAPTIDVAGTASLTLGNVENTGTGAALQIESTGSATVEADGQVQGAVNNLAPTSLTLTGSANYTDGTTAGGEQGLFTGVNGTQSTINSVGQDVTLARNVVLDDTVDMGGTNTLYVSPGSNLVAYREVAVNGNLDVQSGATFTSQAQAGATTNGTTADTGYGRLLVSGNATTEAGSTVALKPMTAYAFTAGQRFDLISAAGTGNYNTGAITATADGFSGTVTPSTVTQNGRTDLVVTLSDPASGTGTGTGTGTGGTGTGTGTSGTGSTTGTGDTTGTTSPSDPSDPGTPSSDPTTPSNPTSPTTPTAPATPALVDVATSPVARATLGGLLGYTGWSPALLNTFDAAVAVAASTPAAANAAGVQLAPVSRSVSNGLVRSMTDGVNGAIAARADATRHDVSQQWSVWGQGIGGAAQQGERAGVDGYNAGYGGIVVGADRAVGEQARVGAMLSYTNSSANGTGNASGQHVGVNALGLTAYGSVGKTWYVNGSVGMSENEFSESRAVNFPGVSAGASGHFHGEAVAATLESGLPIALANGFTVTPFAGLSALYVNQHGYTEGDGGAGVALNVQGGSTTDVRSTVGVKVARAFETKAGTIEPTLRLAYVHDYNGSAASTTANFVGANETTFTTPGLAQPANLADIGLGLTVYRARGLSLSAQADLQIGAGYKSESVMIQARKAF